MKPGMMIFGLLAAAGLILITAKGSEAQEGGQKKYGVIHNIADDRLVERVGGIYEPEGIDKYMKRKFDEVSAQIAGLERKMADVEQKLDSIEMLLRRPHESDTLTS